MAQKTGILIFLAALSLQGVASQNSDMDVPWVPPDTEPAAEAPAPTPVVAQPTPQSPAVTPTPTPGKDVQKIQENPWDRALEKLTPEQRKRFKENLERWNKLPKARQEELRRNEKLRKERILGEIKTAINESGLKLDPQQRQLFITRYDQERRTIEEKLWSELAEKRQQAVADLVKKLTTEFQAPVPNLIPDPAPGAPNAAPPKP